MQPRGCRTAYRVIWFATSLALAFCLNLPRPYAAGGQQPSPQVRGVPYDPSAVPSKPATNLNWASATVGDAENSSADSERRANLIRRRLEWFYGQRAYPLQHIPTGARSRALEQLKEMLGAEGKTATPWSYSLAPDSLTVTSAPQNIPASTTQWTLIGPQPTIPLGDLAGGSPNVSGRVTALAVDPRNSSVVYLGAAEGGVWKTTDGGNTWTPLTDTQPSLAVGSIALDPSNPNIVYVGTGEENFGYDNYYGAGILKSTNGGGSWTQLGAANFAGPFNSGRLGGAYIGSLAVHPTNGQILLAAVRLFDSGSRTGIYRSTDGGITWTAVLTGADGNMVLFDPTNGNIAYAALGTPAANSTNGVYKSADGGQTWAPANGTGGNVLPSSNAGRIAMAIAPSNSPTLFVGIENTTNDSLLGFFKTVDGGTNWTALTNTPDYCKPQCFFDNVIAVHPSNPNVLFAGGINQGVDRTLIRSQDGGTTWTTVSAGANGVNLHTDMHALAFASDGSKLYVGNDGGSWSTTDVTASSVNWTTLNPTLAITQFYPGLSIAPTTANLALGGTQDNSTQQYSGSLAWNSITCGDGGWTAIDFSNPTTAYASCAYTPPNTNPDGTPTAFIRKLSTSGPTSNASTGINGSDRGSFIPPLVMDPTYPWILYFGTYRVYQTTSYASSWTAISTDLTKGAPATITTIAVAPSDFNTVYAGTSDSQVQVTTNAGVGGGASWTNVTSGLPPRSVTQIAVDRRNAQIAYVAFSGFSGFSGDTQGHVFQTTNRGSSWSDISGNLPNTPVNDIVIDPDVSGTLYVATDVGVFQTTNGGSTWSTLVTGLPRVVVLGLKLHRPSRILRASTHGRSAWDLQLPPPSGATAVLSTPSLWFGSLSVGTTSSVQTVTLTNTGSSSLTISSVTVNGDFAGSQNCGGSLAPGANCVLSITFTPTAGGTRNGAITLADSAPDSPQTVYLAGTGSSGATVSLSSTSLTFGSQSVGTKSAVQTITLTNTGGATLTITSVAVSGDFAQSNNCGASVAAGASCTFSLTFTPTATGTRTGTLSIADNAPGSPQTVMLTGTGASTVASFQQMPGLLAQLAVGSANAVWGLNAGGQIYRFNSSTQNWNQVPGLLAQLAVGADGAVWGLNAAGQIYRFNSVIQNWDQVPGLLAQLAVGYDGTVWGLNAANQVYRFNPGTQNWQQMPGLLARLAVGFDGAVWGLNAANQIYRFNPRTQNWDQMPGLLARLAVGFGGAVWGLNAAGQIYRFNLQTQGWDQMPGALSQLAVGGDGSVWGLNAANQIYRFNPQTQNWDSISGAFTQIAVGADGAVWGLNAANQIYQFAQPLTTQTWTPVSGGLAQVAVGADGNVWGVNAANQIFAFNPGTQNWDQIPGLLKQVAVGFGGNVWGINAANQIYQFNPATQGWQPIPGNLTQISVGADGAAWGVNAANQVYRFNPGAQNWSLMPGLLAQIAVGSNSVVWGINAAGQIYRFNTTTQNWDPVAGNLVQIAAAFDGAVWGLNSSNQIYRFNAGTQGWDQIPGQLIQVTVGADAVVWGINAANQIYRFH